MLIPRNLNGEVRGLSSLVEVRCFWVFWTSLGFNNEIPLTSPASGRTQKFQMPIKKWKYERWGWAGKYQQVDSTSVSRVTLRDAAVTCSCQQVALCSNQSGVWIEGRMDGWMEVNSQTFSGFEYSCLAKSTEGLDRPLCACVCVLRGSKSLLRMFAKTQRGTREGGKRRGKNENKEER